MDRLNPIVDVVVTEDRFLQSNSGISMYLNKEVILGALWWKYVGLSMRASGATIVLGGDFDPEKYILIQRLSHFSSKIVLSGKCGLKFFLIKNQLSNALFEGIAALSAH